MSKRYLRSDTSREEARFFTAGQGLWGSENYITHLFKFVGKFEELKQAKKESEIYNYNPKTDNRFKYENKGYSCINAKLNGNNHDYYISRKFLKSLSRKWRFTPIIISFDTDVIIHELISYIMENAKLNNACKIFFENEKVCSGWGMLMPIQSEFISERAANKRKDYGEAERLVLSLSSFFQEREE